MTPRYFITPIPLLLLVLVGCSGGHATTTSPSVTPEPALSATDILQRALPAGVPKDYGSMLAEITVGAGAGSVRLHQDTEIDGGTTYIQLLSSQGAVETLTLPGGVNCARLNRGAWQPVKLPPGTAPQSGSLAGVKLTGEKLEQLPDAESDDGPAYHLRVMVDKNNAAQTLQPLQSLLGDAFPSLDNVVVDLLISKQSLQVTRETIDADLSTQGQTVHLTDSLSFNYELPGIMPRNLPSRCDSTQL